MKPDIWVLGCSGKCSGCLFRWASMSEDRRWLNPANGKCFQPHAIGDYLRPNGRFWIKSQLLCQLSYAPFENGHSILSSLKVGVRIVGEPHAIMPAGFVLVRASTPASSGRVKNL